MENPHAPPGYVVEDNSSVVFYKPLDPRMAAFRINENFVSLLELCDPSLFETPPASDEEIEPGEILNDSIEYISIEDEPVNIVDVDTLISEIKNAHKLLGEVDTPEKGGKRVFGSKVQSTKSNKSVHVSVKCHSSLSSRRSNSRSSSSSTDTSKKHRKSASRDKSFLRFTSRRPSISPHTRTAILVEYQTSSSSPSPSRSACRKKSSSSKRRKSPNRSSPTRRRQSPLISSAPQSRPPSRSSKLPSRYRSQSPTKLPSRYRSPSPTKLLSRYKPPSPTKLPSRYKPPSPTRLPARYRSPSPTKLRSRYQSPSPSRLPSRYKSPSRHTLAKRSPSPRRRLSPVYRHSSLRRSPSPARSSSRSRYKSLKKPSPVRRSPPRERSPTPRRSASHGTFGRSSNRPKSPSKRPRGPKTRINLSPDRPKKIAVEVEDDCTEIQVEEMKKRKIYDGGDLQIESVPQVQKQVQEQVPKAPVVVVVQEKEIQKEKEPVAVTKDIPQDKESLVEKELGRFYEELEQSAPSVLQVEKEKVDNTEKRSEPIDVKGNLPNSFYCSSCQLTLNSESTWQSHINGKKHAKVQKLQTVHEVAKGSIAIPSNPAFAVEEIPRFANPTAGTKQYPIRDVPRLQPAIDNCINYPLIGLDSVREIRGVMEVHYYCELCDAPCSAHSIMPHLTGYKHHLRFLKEIDPVCYEKNKDLPKKRYETQLTSMLFAYELKCGRRDIKVYEEREDLQPMSSYGACGGMSSVKIERGPQGIAEIPANDECLDVSKADFYCKLCDAHMNNINMWEAHVRGKRHLTNAKKNPGENISKARSVKAPGNVRSMLEQLLHENADGEIVVGLDFIRETQGPNGEIYNCFLCGSCCTNFDIVNHLLLTKHRIRYLEKLVADGKTNGITTISQMDLNDDYFRKHLIDDECVKMLEQYGSGRVEVYISKK